MDVFRANSGEITVDGKPFAAKEYKIGYLPEERGLYPKRKVTEQMVFLAELRGMPKAEAKKSAAWWLDRLEITEYANVKLETLSKGNQQKVQLAASLICNPDLVILDEPFSGLDPVNAQMLKDVVTDMIKAGKLVIFSSHQMSYVEEFCDDIVIINKGDVVLSGDLSDIKRTYGKDRLVLSAENYSLEELAKKLEAEASGMLEVVGEKKEFLILQMKQNTSRSEILSWLGKSDIQVERFGRYEPSLNDIFVAAAGEEETETEEPSQAKA